MVKVNKMVHKNAMITQLTSKYIDVYDAKIHYLEEGTGDPIVFLHSFPGSAQCWRFIIPHLMSLGRCIAVDFVGLGKSSQPNISYNAESAIKYFTRFIEILKLKKIIFIMQGFGSIVGLDYAMRNETNCKGFVFCEAFLRPLSEDEVSFPYDEQIRVLQKLSIHEVEKNLPEIIKKMVRQTTMQNLTKEDLNEYALSITGSKAHEIFYEYLHAMPSYHTQSKTDEIINYYSKKILHSNKAKLLIYALPGFITTIACVMWAKKQLSHLEIINIGDELHYFTESYPKVLGEAISIWLQGLS